MIGKRAVKVIMDLQGTGELLGDQLVKFGVKVMMH